MVGGGAWRDLSGAGKLRSVLRVNPRSVWQGLFGAILVALIATGLSIVIAIDLSAEREQEASLATSGVTATVTVVEVTERSRTHDPLEVRVQLPDGRQTLVDLAERPRSNADMEPGARLDVRMLPDDISVNHPADRLNSATSWIANIGPPIGIGIGAVIIAIVLYREARRNSSRPPGAAPRQPSP